MRIKNLLIIILISLLLIGIAAAAVVNYVSNSITASVNIQSECNDGIDNGGVNSAFDMGDPNCHTDMDASNPLSYNVCSNENKSVINITQCI